MSILVYILQVSVCLAIFYGFYHVWLRKETLFESNRTYILVTLISSFSLPLLKIYIDTAVNAGKVISAPVHIGSYVEAISYELSAQPASPFPWDKLLTGIYAIGIAFLSIRLFKAIHEINQIRRIGDRINILGYTCIISDKVKTPFSFFNSIYLPKDHRFNDEELREVVAHELAHVHGKHTLDVLLVETACIFLWPSPLIYLYRKALKDIHEYVADAAVLKETPWELYAGLLLHQQKGQLQNVLSNQLIYSQLKKRLLMMNKERSGTLARFKYLGVVPILLLALTLFSFRERIMPDLGQTLSAQQGTSDSVYQFNVVFPDGYSQADGYDSIPRSKEPNMIGKTHEPYTAVDEMPRFPGCEDEQDKTLRDQCQTGKMFQFIGANLRYPEEDKVKGIEGLGVVKFVVQANGQLTDIQVVRSPSPAMEKEMIRLMNVMAALPEKWIPGRHEGVAVPVAMTLPFKFKLEDKTSADVLEAVSPVKFPGCSTISDKTEQSNCSQQGIYKFIAEHLKYPETDRKNNIEGTGIAKFIIDEQGRMTNIVVMRSPSESIKAEILRVMQLMASSAGAWTPARKEGKAVSAEMVLPVVFKLDDTSDKPEGTDQTNAPRPVKSIQVNPNPATNEITIEKPEGVTSVSIFDEHGKQVLTEKVSTGNTTTIRINVSNLKPGWYAVQLSGDELIGTGKFSIIR
jgi:TonB family protein